MRKENKQRITITLDDNQLRELEILMEEDGQTVFTTYFVYLIMQEKKRRVEGAPHIKRPVGRPKKEEVEEDTNMYPAPYEGGGAYTRLELEAWYAFRDKKMPPMPKPLTKEELKKYN